MGLKCFKTLSYPFSFSPHPAHYLHLLNAETLSFSEIQAVTTQHHEMQRWDTIQSLLQIGNICALLPCLALRGWEQTYCQTLVVSVRFLWEWTIDWTSGWGLRTEASVPFCMPDACISGWVTVRLSGMCIVVNQALWGSQANTSSSQCTCSQAHCDVSATVTVAQMGSAAVHTTQYEVSREKFYFLTLKCPVGVSSTSDLNWVKMRHIRHFPKNKAWVRFIDPRMPR